MSDELNRVDSEKSTIPGLDEEKMAALREKLKQFQKKDEAGTTVSGSEAVRDENVGPVSDGKDVDWAEYDLEYSVRHLYPQAMLREVNGEPKWVVTLDEFYSDEMALRSHGKRTEKGDPLNAGDFLNNMLNGPEGWKLISILPGSTGRCGLVLQRKVPYVLPDPRPLAKETVVEQLTDPELERVEKAALDYAADLNVEVPDLATTEGDDDGVGNQD